MTIDKAALKAAAEAATPGQWRAGVIDTDCVFGDVNNPALMAPHFGRVLLRTNRHFPTFEADARFVALANPATILELLAEIEALTAAREGAPGRLAHVLDDTRGFHVESLDDDIRDKFMHRLARAAFDVTLPTSWHPVKPQKGDK